MSSLRLFPFELLKETVSYLDLDSCALLYSTLDWRIQRFFRSAGAVTFLALTRLDTWFFPAQRYLLKSLVSVDSIELVFEYPNEGIVSLPERLAPRHLKLHAVTLNPRKMPSNFTALFASLSTLKLTIQSRQVFAFGLDKLLLALPPSLGRFHLDFDTHYYDPICKQGKLKVERLLARMPSSTSLFSLKLRFAGSEDKAPTATLSWIFEKFPNLQELVISSVRVLEEDPSPVSFPKHLTRLSFVCTSPGSDPKYACLRAIGLAAAESDTTQCSAENVDDNFAKRFPASLTQLEIPSSKLLAALPRQVTNLTIASLSNTSMVHVLMEVLPTMSALRSLTIQDWHSPGIVAHLKSKGRFPYRWSPFKWIATEIDLDSFCAVFDKKQLAQLQDLALNLQTLRMVDLKRVLEAFPTLRLKVALPIQLNVSELNLPALPLQRFYTLLVEQGPLHWLIELSTALKLKPAIHEVSFNLCCDSMSTLHFSSVTIPINPHQSTLAKDGPLKITYRGGGVPLWTPGSAELKKVKFEVCDATPAPPPRLESCLVTRHKLCPLLQSLNTPKEVNPPMQLVHIDLGDAPFSPDDLFWTAIPHSVTHLRSNYQFDRQFEFGGKTKHTEPMWKFPRKFRAYAFTVLDTPYFVFKVSQLSQLCSKNTLKTLTATISDKDTSIFEFAQARPKSRRFSFLYLQELTLRAFPIVTGNLLFNHRNITSNQELAEEAMQALRLLRVRCIHCLFHAPIALHPRTTQILFSDIRVDSHPFPATNLGTTTTGKRMLTRSSKTA